MLQWLAEQGLLTSRNGLRVEQKTNATWRNLKSFPPNDAKNSRHLHSFWVNLCNDFYAFVHDI